MKTRIAQIQAVGQLTLKAYLIFSAVMFVGGIIVGAVLAVAGYDLPAPF
jgi:hydrogenase/urease accessory protein HupE